VNNPVSETQIMEHMGNMLILGTGKNIYMNTHPAKGLG
jgi:hypothetical protein